MCKVPLSSVPRVQGLDFAKNTAAGLKDPESEMQFFQTAKESNTST